MTVQKTIRFPDKVVEKIEEERQEILKVLKIRPSFNEMLIRIVDSYYNGNQPKENVSPSSKDTFPDKKIDAEQTSVPDSEQENVSPVQKDTDEKLPEGWEEWADGFDKET